MELAASAAAKAANTETRHLSESIANVVESEEQVVLGRRVGKLGVRVFHDAVASPLDFAWCTEALLGNVYFKTRSSDRAIWRTDTSMVQMRSRKKLGKVAWRKARKCAASVSILLLTIDGRPIPTILDLLEQLLLHGVCCLFVTHHASRSSIIIN